ncbi:hypothetical protein AB0E77_29215, partial [Streptomyces sp. NPDC032940]|uniref:hypothetical protein n=1 Tax=Streptomyces sp. NPDC032940 TaxID=3155366 RepID=UPI0033E68412
MGAAPSRAPRAGPAVRITGGPNGERPTARRQTAPGRRRADAAAARGRSLRIEEIGGASMMKTFDDAFGDDFQKA